MKKYFIFFNINIVGLLFLLMINFTVFSQSTPKYYNNNTSNSSNTFPLSSATNKVQWIYPPNAFKTAGSSGTASGAGTINRIYFRIGSTANATSSYADFTISLAQNVGTNSTFSSATWNTGMTVCLYKSTHQLTGATANSWYGVTLTTPFTYDPNKSLVFEMKTTSTSGSNYMAQNNSAGTCRIYGTYASTPSGSGFGAGLVDFGIDLMKGSNDAGISALNEPLCTPTITGIYTNDGVNTIDSVKINWSVNGTLQSQMKYTTAVPSGKSVNITFTPDYNFKDGDNYNVKAWTSMPNNKTDTVNGNDTMLLSFQFKGQSLDPKVTDFKKCGIGYTQLQAIPGNASDSLVWYDAATGGNLIARGKNAQSPFLNHGSDTFYVQAAKIGAPSSLANSMTPSVGYGSTYSGGFANITPKVNVMIDSFCVVLTSNIQDATFNVYMRAGTYVGYHNTSTGWTKLASNVVAKVRQVGSYYRAYIKMPETLLDKGNTYGFYITTTPVKTSSPWSTASGAGITLNNNHLTVFQDRICYGTTEFGTSNTSYSLTWETFYRPSNCQSNRVPLVITVKPSPYGATLKKGALFQSTMLYTSGSKGSPDIVAKNDKISWEITPPTGYNNTDYGVTWAISNLLLRTPSGTIIPTSYYSPSAPTPTGSNNALITFSPDAALVDSTIIMTMLIKDLGPHYCDSTLTRYIFVAPRPVPDFKFPQPVCDGDNVIFTNTSTVSSGNLLSKWDFGTGKTADTSNNTDAVFTFPTHGIYMVKLITTTSPYNYKDSIMYSVDITEIPKIGFKVFNACLGDSVSFVNSTTISKGAITYKWDMGNGKTSNRVNPKHKYTTPGSYKVTLTATSNGCSEVLS
ncbi:MAG: PKD domain-containing protein, partial [Bacteroidia bacterium]|nr:PKD domain-containing protein [Bacteroidia bacterium]